MLTTKKAFLVASVAALAIMSGAGAYARDCASSQSWHDANHDHGHNLDGMRGDWVFDHHDDDHHGHDDDELHDHHDHEPEEDGFAADSSDEEAT